MQIANNSFEEEVSFFGTLKNVLFGADFQGNGEVSKKLGETHWLKIAML